ncbi:MAG: hypothetical protein KDA25_03985 [Phycisphaerales bacterium]|nr:hypothetical protein [Phycisphaerales bacterium]
MPFDDARFAEAFRARGTHVAGVYRAVTRTRSWPERLLVWTVALLLFVPAVALVTLLLVAGVVFFAALLLVAWIRSLLSGVFPRRTGRSSNIRVIRREGP